MKISFLIVTRNRPVELALTLKKIFGIIDPQVHEVRVFIDGCLETQKITQDYDWVHWESVEKSIGASPSRNKLYRSAQGDILIGLDDDAHPLSSNFIDAVESRFRESENLAIIAFQEVRGVFENDEVARANARHGDSFPTSDFVGCGFAIKRVIYLQTSGFPVWMDIYGEETVVALQVLEKGYDICYDFDIQVNHRVDVEARKLSGRNYFRFEKQLANSMAFYIVLHPQPVPRILRLLQHNWSKYAIKDMRYFKSFLKVVLVFPLRFSRLVSLRHPVKRTTIQRTRELKPINFS